MLPRGCHKVAEHDPRPTPGRFPTHGNDLANDETLLYQGFR